MDLMEQVIGLVVKATTFGGGFWLLWGAIVLAGGLKDKTGPQIQSGIWQIVGGGLIIGASALFSTLVV